MKKIKIVFSLILIGGLFSIFSPNLIYKNNIAEADCKVDGCASKCFTKCSLVSTAGCSLAGMFAGTTLPICFANSFGWPPESLTTTCIDVNLAGLTPKQAFLSCEAIALVSCGLVCNGPACQRPCVCTEPPANLDGTTKKICAGDEKYWDIGGNYDLPWKEGCTARKCEYYTPTESYACSGSDKIPEGSSLCEGDSVGLTSAMAWHPVDRCGMPKCEYIPPAKPKCVCEKTQPNCLSGDCGEMKTGTSEWIGEPGCEIPEGENCEPPQIFCSCEQTEENGGWMEVKPN